MPDIFQQIFDFAKANYEYVLVFVGIFVMFGAWHNWTWVVEMRNVKLIGTRTFIKEAFCEEALWKFQRVLTFLCGLVLFIYGLLVIYLKYNM